MFHYGHENLLRRAKEIGDYLIVGVTSDNFDFNRGKLNVRQSLGERIIQVQRSGYADEIIVEEYEGQKIDDIVKYEIDYFVIGSDWKGKFDYLSAYCKVIYLDRTKGISSTLIRNKQDYVTMGIVGYTPIVNKFIEECKYVSGLDVKGICIDARKKCPGLTEQVDFVTDNLEELCKSVDAVYIYTSPIYHFKIMKYVIEQGKHVLCECPIALNKAETEQLYCLADEKKVVLYEGIKTAHFLAFSRLAALIKSGSIGEVRAVDITCTSLKVNDYWSLSKELHGGSMNVWGPYALLAVFKILGYDYRNLTYTVMESKENSIDLFTKLDFVYDNAVATAKLGLGVKSEGELIISGTKGYIFVPSPWWKTDYFEIRYEDFTRNKRFFYQLEGEGFRYELADFLKGISEAKTGKNLDFKLSLEIAKVMEQFAEKAGNIVYIN